MCLWQCFNPPLILVHHVNDNDDDDEYDYDYDGDDDDGLTSNDKTGFACFCSLFPKDLTMNASCVIVIIFIIILGKRMNAFGGHH